MISRTVYWYGIGLFLCLITLGITGETGEDTDEKELRNTFRSELYGVTFRAPENWERELFSGESVVTYFRRRGQQNTRILRIDLIVKSPVRNLEKAVQGLRRGYRGEGTNYTPLHKKQISVSGEKGIWYEGRYNAGGIGMRQMDLVVIRDEVLYLMSIKGYRSVYEEQRRLLRKILFSLDVFTPPEIDQDTKELFLRRFRLAERYFRKDHIEKSLHAYRRSARVFPASPEVHKRLQRLYLKVRRYRDSIREGHVVLKKISDCVQCYYRLGVANYKRNRLKKAEKYMNEALKRSPGYQQANLRYAEILMARQKLEESLNILEQMLDRYPKHLQVRMLLGRVYLETEQHQQATNMFRSVLELESGHEKAKEALRKVRRLRGTKKYEK